MCELLRQRLGDCDKSSADFATHAWGHVIHVHGTADTDRSQEISPAETLLIFPTLFNADARRWLVLTEALSLVQQVRSDDELASIRTDRAALVKKRALSVTVG